MRHDAEHCPYRFIAFLQQSAARRDDGPLPVSFTMLATEPCSVAAFPLLVAAKRRGIAGVDRLARVAERYREQSLPFVLPHGFVEPVGQAAIQGFKAANIDFEEQLCRQTWKAPTIMIATRLQKQT